MSQTRDDPPGLRLQSHLAWPGAAAGHVTVRTPRTDGSEWIASNPQPVPPTLQRIRPTVNPSPSTRKPIAVHARSSPGTPSHVRVDLGTIVAGASGYHQSTFHPTGLGSAQPPFKTSEFQHDAQSRIHSAQLLEG